MYNHTVLYPPTPPAPGPLYIKWCHKILVTDWVSDGLTEEQQDLLELLSATKNTFCLFIFFSIFMVMKWNIYFSIVILKTQDAKLKHADKMIDKEKNEDEEGVRIFYTMNIIEEYE